MNAPIIKDYFLVNCKAMKLETLYSGLADDNWVSKGKIRGSKCKKY
jgi:hypothetical protein